jgi:hypothetical protein
MSPVDVYTQAMAPKDQLQRIEEQAPASIMLPTGTKARIDYARDPPIIRAKLQVGWPSSVHTVQVYFQGVPMYSR